MNTLFLNGVNEVLKENLNSKEEYTTASLAVGAIGGNEVLNSKGHTAVAIVECK